MSNVLNANSIKAKIATFSTNRTALQKLGHEIAMDIFRHAAPKSLPDCNGSNNATLALTLAKEMPKSWQVQLSNWFAEFTPIRIVVKNDKVGLTDAYKAIKGQSSESVAAREKHWNIAEAEATPFYEFEEPDSVSKDLDLSAIIKMVEQMAKRIEKKVEEKKVKPEHVNAANAAAALVAGLDFTAIKALVAKPANTDEKDNKGQDKETPLSSWEQDMASAIINAGGENLADEPLKNVVNGR